MKFSISSSTNFTPNGPRLLSISFSESRLRLPSCNPSLLKPRPIATGRVRTRRVLRLYCTFSSAPTPLSSENHGNAMTDSFYLDEDGFDDNGGNGKFRSGGGGGGGGGGGEEIAGEGGEFCPMARFAKAMKEKEKKKPIGQLDSLRDMLLKLLEEKEPIGLSDSLRDMLLKLLEEKEPTGQSDSLRGMHLKLLEVKELIGQLDSPWDMYQKKLQEGEEKLPIGESYPAVVIYPRLREPTLPSEEFPEFLAELVSSPATLVVAVEGSTDLLGKFQQFADDCLRGNVSLLHLPKRFVCRGEWSGDRFLLKVMVSNTQYCVAVHAMRCS